MYRLLVNLCLVALHMGSNSLEASPIDDGGFLFSGPIYHEMPLSCRGKRFCFDKGVDYPTSTVEKLIDEMPKWLNTRIGTNLGDHVNANDDCPVNDTFIDKPIYYILDESDNVRVVAQSSQKFLQLYSVKWCLRPGRITEDTPTFVKGSPTLLYNRIECVNQYMDAEFLVLSDQNDELQFSRPKGGIPVCCRCRYSKLTAKVPASPH